MNFKNNLCAGGEFRTRDLQIMSIALVGEPLEFTNLTGTLTRLSYPGILYAPKYGKLNDSTVLNIALFFDFNDFSILFQIFPFYIFIFYPEEFLL